MSTMRKITTDRELSAFLGLLKKRGGAVGADVEKAVGDILASVKKHGDKALKLYTKRFDGHERLVIKKEDIDRYAAKADKSVVAALRFSARRIRAFHKRQKQRSWAYTCNGIKLGQIVSPLGRVGVYVPGGRAAYPSTVLMNVIPAQAAGVTEIALTCPTPGGEPNPAVMAAIKLLGIEEVYSIGGAQAVAALAYGTETVRPVDKIVGPGNIYVATAKRMVFGTVSIDMIAGPSEILIIADRGANPAFIAADLLSQAEHDELASSVLITDSPTVADAAIAELKRQLRGLKRKTIASKSLKNYGAVILVKEIGDAAEIANRIAPEHLEIMTEHPAGMISEIKNAGAIFLGSLSPEPLGDYSAGPNHTLPTGGTARFSSPLGVYDFMKRTSLIGFSKKGFDSLADVVERLATAEGLDAHANAIRIRRG